MTEYKVALKNVLISFAVNAISFIVSFITIYFTNQYLGTSNYGLLNIALAFVPYVTLLTSSIDSITLYRLYEPLSKQNYELANKMMQRSLYEYRTRGAISFSGLLVMSILFPIIIGQTNMIDNVINGLIILAAGLSTLFSFLLSPIYQRVLTVERKGYLLQIFDLIGKLLFNGIFITILITNSIYGYMDNNWLLVLSAFVTNLASSFGVIFAFVMRKKIASWFIPKVLKSEVGDQHLRRQILCDAIIAQFVVNTSFFVFAIYNNFYANSLVLAGIYANYFLVKNSVTSVLSIVVNVPGNSYARIHHTSKCADKVYAFEIYDYLAFVIAVAAMFFVLFGSPYVTSFVVSKPSAQTINNLSFPNADQLLGNAFNVWISFIVAITCFIEIARNPTENYKSITGEYKWKLHFAIYEAIINVVIAISSTLIAYYFPNLFNGLFLIFGLIFGTAVSTGFRFVALKVSVMKALYKDKSKLNKSLFFVFLVEIIWILMLGIVFTLTSYLLMGNEQINLALNLQSILILFLVLLISLLVISINVGIFIAINSNFRNLILCKAKELIFIIKSKSKKKY